MYHCSHCDAQSLKWQGRCTECGKWGTFSESSEPKSSSKKSTGGTQKASLLDLANTSTAEVTHLPTNISEVDRVLSGGIVEGSVTLLAGEPGIGKSTLVAMIAAKMAERKQALYVSGEESQGQLLMRFKRLNISPNAISFTPNTDIDAVVAAAKELQPSLVIVDSIQTMQVSDNESFAGSPNAIRASTATLIGLAKQSGIPVLIIGQVTKDGHVAGPKMLEHLVDTVLTMEGDEQSSYRILRSTKNRFGGTDEVGIFEMTEMGLICVENPSARFLEERAKTPGSVITCIMEGTRPFLVEIQALAEKSVFANPVRRTSGFDAGRLQMLLAIISKRAKVNVSAHDIYVNVVGGMKIKDHSTDLAVCVAIISCVKDKMIQGDAMIVGELGLGGEVRSVPFLERRIKEAERLGVKNFLTPKTTKHLSDV